MHMLSRAAFRILVTAVLSLGAGDVIAAAQRTFVASYGKDTDPCSLALPCRSFNVAIGATLSTGEVVILDTAGYGPMVINKAIKVIGPSGVYGGISVVGAGNATTGIVINAGDADVVTLRGLDVSGVPGNAGPFPLHGIDIQNAGTVHIEKTSISNFTQNASSCINMTPARLIPVYVSDSYLRECRNGITIVGGSTIEIDNTRIERQLNTETTGTIGVNAQQGAAVMFRNGTITNTGSSGIAFNAFNNNGTTITRLGIVNSTVSQMFRGIATSGNGVANVVVNITNSQFEQNDTVLAHGFGFVSVQGSFIVSNVNSLVNCGSGAVTSLGTTLIAFNADTTLPGGCFSFITNPNILAGK
jgi:hypothetical protein